MPLDLLFPDLLLPQDAPAPLLAIRLPELERWLARADDVRKNDARSSTEWLGKRFGLPSPAPVAAISLAGEGERAIEGAWLRADPVHLRIANDHVRLEPSALDVRADEAAALAAALQAHFAADGLEVHVVAPERWYVRVASGHLPRTTPFDQAVGRDVYGLMPAAGGPFNWRAAMTEAQMVMAPHAVNAAREAEGKPAINSVWLWGEGSLPETASQPYALVCADDAFVRGLGEWSGAEVRPQPGGLAEIGPVREDETALASIDDLTPALRGGREGAWRRAAETLDERWFAAMKDAIARFGIVRIVMPAESGTSVATLTAPSRWRWFRARKPLTAYA